MSVELRQLKDAVTGLPFVPVTHWDAISNKPNIDSSLSTINASLDALDASVKALDASIRNINIPIKTITGETGLTEYANSNFVAVSASQPDQNGNVLIDASVRVVTLADASNGHDGLASALDVYNTLADAEYVIAQHNIGIIKSVGLENDYSIDWSASSGINSSTIKDAIEYVAVNGGVQINDSSINTDETWSSNKINTEITGLKTVVDASLVALDTSMDEVYSKFVEIDSSLAALDASIKDIDIPIKSITGEAGLAEYANSEFVSVSVSEPDENGNVNVDASVKVVTLVDASNGIDGLASASDVYNNLSNIEEVMASVISKLNYIIGLDSSVNLVWSEESGLTEDTIKEAIEYVSMNAGVKINDSSVNASETWSSQKISDELNDIDIVQINDSSIDSSMVWSSQKVNNEIQAVKGTPYLKFTANTAGSTIALSNYSGNTPDIKYSRDGVNWTQWDYSAITLTNVSDYVYMKGDNSQGFSSSSSIYSQFVMTGSIAGSGNIMSLIDNGACQTLAIQRNYCYCNMFRECSSLTSAPELPATTLANGCYYGMFQGCTSLTSAPELPATTLTISCYQNMFQGCTSLTSAPELLATTLANQCYYQMFKGCSNLTNAPTELPATALTNYCYYYMFQNCSRLSYIKCLATTGINENDSTTGWVSGVASTGIFVKDINATWPTGNNGIPTRWNYINLSDKQTYENGHIYDSSVNSLAEGVLNGSIGGIVINQCVASGINSHAEGFYTTASGEASHAEGNNTIASGEDSHAEGLYTQTNNVGEHAQGKYNLSHSNTLHSIGIGSSDSSRMNAVEVLDNGDVYINGIGNYDGTNLADAETLQNSLADLIPITYDDLLQKVNSKSLIPGKKYLITDYITKINNSDFTSLEKKYDGIVCEAISNSELSKVNCKAILSYEGSGPNEDVYIWIDNFPESIIEDEPDILQNYHDDFREYFRGSKLHRLGKIEFESESYWLWEYVTNNGFGSDNWIPDAQYALTLESDFEGNTLLDDVTNINRPILYYLGSDKSQIDYGEDGSKHDEYAWVVVKQEKYTYDPTTITSNTIYVEKFSYDPLSGDIDQSYYEETNFYEEGPGTTNEYKLRGTLEWDNNEYYLWELTSGHAVDDNQPQYSWMLTKTADFRGLSLQDDYENNRYCPCYCFLNEDKSEAYLDGNDNYQNHEILLIQAVYDPSEPEVKPLSGGGGETKIVEYEIGYDITKQFDGHKGTILYMQDEYGNSANFDFKNIKSKKYGFLFGGENDLTLDGTYKENKVLGELREFSICSETCYGSTFTQNCLGTIYQNLENCEVSYDNNQFVVFDPYHHETLNTILIEHQKNIEDIDTVTSSLLVNHEDRIRELEAKIEQLTNA